MTFLSRRELDLLHEEIGVIHKHLHTLVQQGTMIMATLQEVLTAEQDERSELDRVLAAIDSIEQQLKDAQANGNDPAAIQSILDQIASNKQAMVDKLNSIAQAPPADNPPVTVTPPTDDGTAAQDTPPAA